MFKSTKRIASAGLALGLTLGAGVAFAAWTGSGTLSAGGHTASVQSLEITATLGGDLFPGGATSLSGKVCNPNPISVVVTSVDFAKFTEGPDIRTASAVPLRNNLNPTANSLTGQRIPAKGSGCVDFTFENAVGLANGALDSDQGKTFAAVYNVKFVVDSAGSVG